MGKLGRKDKAGEGGGAEAAPPATITFEAPCHVYWTRCAAAAPGAAPRPPPPCRLTAAEACPGPWESICVG